MITAARAKFNEWHTSSQLAFLLVLLNIWDFQSTKILVDGTGYEAEANPVLYNAMIAMDSVYAILLIKIAVFAFFGYWYSQLLKTNNDKHLISLKTLSRVLWILVAAFFAICVSNTTLVYFMINN